MPYEDVNGLPFTLGRHNWPVPVNPLTVPADTRPRDAYESAGLLPPQAIIQKDTVDLVAGPLSYYERSGLRSWHGSTQVYSDVRGIPFAFDDHHRLTVLNSATVPFSTPINDSTEILDRLSWRETIGPPDIPRVADLTDVVGSQAVFPQTAGALLLVDMINPETGKAIADGWLVSYDRTRPAYRDVNGNCVRARRDRTAAPAPPSHDAALS